MADEDKCFLKSNTESDSNYLDQDKNTLTNSSNSTPEISPSKSLINSFINGKIHQNYFENTEIPRKIPLIENMSPTYNVLLENMETTPLSERFSELNFGDKTNIKEYNRK